jgi:glycerophosphoryl diester phosphodiesterase
MNILLDPTARPVVGHRGNAAHAPENTLESFAQAVAAGADALEFDVRLSADGVVVVHHDPTVTRTTGAAGAVAQLTLAQLRALDAGATFSRDRLGHPYAGQGLRIPTLDEVIDAFPHVPLLIEIKTAAASAASRRCVERHDAEARCVIDAFDDRALRAFHDSPIATGAARGDVAALLVPALRGATTRAGRYSVVCTPLSYHGVPLPVRGFVQALRPSGRPVHVWTVNSPDTAAALWDAGVCGIISDDPALIVARRKAEARKHSIERAEARRRR